VSNPSSTLQNRNSPAKRNPRLCKSIAKGTRLFEFSDVIVVVAVVVVVVIVVIVVIVIVMVVVMFVIMVVVMVVVMVVII
jgi:Flp pilus assembly protein TadB